MTKHRQRLKKHASRKAQAEEAARLARSERIKAAVTTIVEVLGGVASLVAIIAFLIDYL